MNGVIAEVAALPRQVTGFPTHSGAIGSASGYADGKEHAATVLTPRAILSLHEEDP